MYKRTYKISDTREIERFSSQYSDDDKEEGDDVETIKFYSL